MCVWSTLRLVVHPFPPSLNICPSPLSVPAHYYSIHSAVFYLPMSRQRGLPHNYYWLSTTWTHHHYMRPLGILVQFLSFQMGCCLQMATAHHLGQQFSSDPTPLPYNYVSWIYAKYTQLGPDDARPPPIDTLTPHDPSCLPASPTSQTIMGTGFNWYSPPITFLPMWGTSHPSSSSIFSLRHSHISPHIPTNHSIHHYIFCSYHHNPCQPTGPPLSSCLCLWQCHQAINNIPSIITF